MPIFVGGMHGPFENGSARADFRQQAHRSIPTIRRQQRYSRTRFSHLQIDAHAPDNGIRSAQSMNTLQFDLIQHFS